MEEEQDIESVSKLKEEIETLKRRVEQEKSARIAIEKQNDTSISLHQENQELRKQNEYLKKNIIRRTNSLTTLIKNLHAGILLEDENYRIILINQKFCALFGLDYDPELFVGQGSDESAYSIKHLFEDPAYFENSISRLVTGRKLAVNEIFKMKDGRVLERDFIPVYSGDEYMGHMWQYREVTESFYYEERIRQSEEKYRGIIENMELGLLEVDADHCIVKAYKSFCEMTGYTQEELMGKNAIELFFSKQYWKMIEEQDQKRKSGKQSVYEVQMKRKDGEIIWVLIGGSPFYDENGKFSGSIGIHYNITAQKELENELREARIIAENAREAEKQFLANMSHEIRNPINAIAGIINLLYDTHLSDEQLEYLNNIKYAADILLGLISDILDLSKIEAGKMELNEKHFELDENIRAIVKTYNFKSSDRDISFSYDLDKRLAEPVMADPTVINQILLNLIGNAVKFTEHGDVNISALVVEESETHFVVEIKVTDTGIGISDDQLEQIFNTFHQGNKQTKLRYGGTGLGLSIVRQLLKLYEGTIAVESEQDKGSTFTFTLKLRRGHLVKREAEDISGTKNFQSKTIRHVLIVEDNKINQQYLIGLLRKWKITYDLANHGGEAVELIEENTYDLVLMDIRMPVMDGYETTIRIRNHTNNPNCNVPIVALTASALVDEKARAFEAGMNFHLTKPFSPDQLVGIMDSISPVDVTVTAEPDKYDFSKELDKEYLETFYEGDLERASLMFQIFLDNIEQEISDLKRLYIAESWEEFGKFAHRVKPNFAMVGLSPFTELMKQFESHGKQNNGTALKEIVPNFFQEYKNKIKLVRRELSRMNTSLEKK